MELYNSICKSFSPIRAIGGKRKQAVGTRWKTFPTLQKFEEAFQNAEASDFMQGDNDRNWIANFDWIMTEANFPKVLENRYKNREKPAEQRKYNDTSYDISELERKLLYNNLEV